VVDDNDNNDDGCSRSIEIETGLSGVGKVSPDECFDFEYQKGITLEREKVMDRC